MKKIILLLITSLMFSSQIFASINQSSEIEDEIQVLVASDDSDSEPYADEEPQPSDEEPSESEEENPEI